MLYRVRDYDQVCNIADNRYNGNHEDFNVQKCAKEVVDIAQTDILKQNVEVTLSFKDSMSLIVKGDPVNFK